MEVDFEGDHEQLLALCLDGEIDAFVKSNGVDERAADVLRKCCRGTQKKVLALGGLSTARNPSATLLARIAVANPVAAEARRARKRVLANRRRGMPSAINAIKPG